MWLIFQGGIDFQVGKDIFSIAVHFLCFKIYLKLTDLYKFKKHTSYSRHFKIEQNRSIYMDSLQYVILCSLLQYNRAACSFPFSLPQICSQLHPVMEYAEL